MSDNFFDDFGQGVSGGLDIATKLQSLSQSRDRFAHEQRQIQMQDEYMSQLNGMQAEVGKQLAAGKFDATALMKRYPRMYKEIQGLQAEEQHLTRAGAAAPAGQLIQSIQSGDLNGADQILAGNAETIDKILGYPGAHQKLREQLRSDPSQVLERAKKAYIMASGSPTAPGIAPNTFDPKAQAQIQKLDDNYSGKIDKLKSSADASADAIQSLDTIIGNLEKAQKSDSLGHPALWRDVSAYIPGSDARDLREALSPSLAQGYITAINQAKAAGGGGLRISQQEIATLSKGLGSLDIGQSDKQLSGNIKNLLTRFKVQRQKLVQHQQESTVKLQAANQQYSAFQQQSGMAGDPLTQQLIGGQDQGQGQGIQQPAGQMPAAPAGQPMQDQTIPQAQMQQQQAQAPAQAQGQGQPTQHDLDYVKRHPETVDRFVSVYGFNPLK